MGAAAKAHITTHEFYPGRVQPHVTPLKINITTVQNECSETGSNGTDVSLRVGKCRENQGNGDEALNTR